MRLIPQNLFQILRLLAQRLRLADGITAPGVPAAAASTEPRGGSETTPGRGTANDGFGVTAFAAGVAEDVVAVLLTMPLQQPPQARHQPFAPTNPSRRSNKSVSSRPFEANSRYPDAPELHPRTMP